MEKQKHIPHLPSNKEFIFALLLILLAAADARIKDIGKLAMGLYGNLYISSVQEHAKGK